MDEKQVLETAQLMFLQNKGRKEVIDFIESNGIVGEAAQTMATNAFLAIKDQRREMMEELQDADESGGGGGMGSIVMGAIFLIGGVVATMSTDSIWYGAIGVGIISIISGIAKGTSQF